MSDPKSTYGEPVEEQTEVDDVVGRAHEGLADAEAAGRDAVGFDGAPGASPEQPAEAPAAESASAEPAVVFDEHEQVEDFSTLDPTDYSAPAAYTPQAESAPAAEYVPPAAESALADAPTVVAEPLVTASEPVYDEAPVYVAPVAGPQHIFVQAPEAPLPRGNRAAAGAIGLLAALSFAILYLGAWLGFAALDGDVTADNVGSTALSALSTWSLWVPVAVFFIAFWLLGAIINRGRWWAWVIFGLLVGAAAYGGHILGELFQAPFWLLTAREGADLAGGQLLAPLAIAALVIGRELTIWFGAWVAARGRRVTELNNEAQREYERTLEAGPQLVRS